MTDLVNPTEIEEIVGAKRHTTRHLARVDPTEGTVYILHSHQCRDSGVDLRDCPYSVALDGGINYGDWFGYEDKPVVVTVSDGWLVPDPNVTCGSR